jgi:hypothetical protein
VCLSYEGVIGALLPNYRDHYNVRGLHILNATVYLLTQSAIRSATLLACILLQPPTTSKELIPSPTVSVLFFVRTIGFVLASAVAPYLEDRITFGKGRRCMRSGQTDSNVSFCSSRHLQTISLSSSLRADPKDLAAAIEQFSVDVNCLVLDGKSENQLIRSDLYSVQRQDP